MERLRKHRLSDHRQHRARRKPLHPLHEQLKPLALVHRHDRRPDQRAEAGGEEREEPQRHDALDAEAGRLHGSRGADRLGEVGEEHADDEDERRLLRENKRRNKGVPCEDVRLECEELHF